MTSSSALTLQSIEPEVTLLMTASIPLLLDLLSIILKMSYVPSAMCLLFMVNGNDLSEDELFAEDKDQI